MITFQKIQFSNFLSVGDREVTINLNQNKTTLIHGVNGAGKSTILDVICYCLFNKPFRNIRLPQLVNTQNKKGLLTAVTFHVGRDKYVVVRGAKPKVFEIHKNGQRLMAKAADKDNQAHLEQNILKLTFKSFTQIVILGSSNYIPFMQLNAAGRRECVEDFLDIKVFSTMSLLAKERLRMLKDNHDLVTRDISTAGYKIEIMEERIRELKQRQQADVDTLETELGEVGNKCNHNNQLIKDLSAHLETQGILVSKQDSNHKKKLKWEKMKAQLETKLSGISKDIEFYKTNNTCPACDQELTEDTKEKHLTAKTIEGKDIVGAISSSNDHIQECSKLVRVYNQRMKYITHVQMSVREYETEVKHLMNRGNAIVKQLKGCKQDTSVIDKEMGKLEMMQEQLTTLQEHVFQIQQDICDHEMIVAMLKEGGIKTQIVKKYLPIMNKFIRKYLSDLDFPIHFKLDEEFSETVSSPLHQDFSYASFSEGQKARIDLALMFTWREVTKLKNSVTCNLLVLDEVFSSSLDEVGKECLLSILRYQLSDDQRVVVIDHTLSQAFKDKFDKTIEVSKNKGFSQYS